MLKHIPALLTPDALHALASMGHGDELAIVDAHFPAARLAAQGGARLARIPGADTPALLRAVLALLPLDDFGPEAAWTMQPVQGVGDAAMPPASAASAISAPGVAVSAVPVGWGAVRVKNDMGAIVRHWPGAGRHSPEAARPCAAACVISS